MHSFKRAGSALRPRGLMNFGFRIFYENILDRLSFRIPLKY